MIKNETKISKSRMEIGRRIIWIRVKIKILIKTRVRTREKSDLSSN